MLTARIIVLMISLSMVLVIAAFIGCSPDRTGTALSNAQPQVFMVNTPPDEAQFSRNPDLNWYATDIDGFITMFRYTVVLESLMVINGQRVPPDDFARLATEKQMGWDTLRVDLDHPQSTARVRLYANVDFPIDSFVTQYFFIQAQDDQELKSDIRWRMYSRNNHYPNTHFRTGNVFINAKSPDSPMGGITLDWDGADSVDWGRALPPLEYEWRLFGPFEENSIVYVNLVDENCVYDPVGDSFFNCIQVPVLDIEHLPPAVGNKAQPLVHSKGPNFANDPNDVWVTDRETTIYDVYKGMNLTETSKYRFIFWVRARDDGYVPDPTPSFGQFYVAEALFERNVAVIDETGYTTRQGRWGPRDLDTVKACYFNYIHKAGYTDFDTVTGKDFFFTTNKKNDLVSVDSAGLVNRWPDLLDILKHKVIIFNNDDAEGGPNETTFGLLQWAFFGLDMGSSGACFSRNLGDATRNNVRGTPITKSLTFQLHFGISQVVVEGWLRGVFLDPFHPIFNEEFIGAYANLEGYPNVMVDYGPPEIVGTDTIRSLLDLRYPRLFLDSTHVMMGLPEVGVGTRTTFAAPLYLYLSKDGDRSIFNGKVNAVAQQIGDMRSVCFMFTPLAMDTINMQVVFDKVLPWLTAKFGSSSSEGMKIPTYQPREASYEERQRRIAEFLEYMSFYASPEEQEAFGATLPPLEVYPDGGGGK
jgi:hypothetical protein